MNATDCPGAYISFYVPAAFVEPSMPAAYGLSLAGNAADVALHVFSCSLVSVRGVDVGPASIALVTVAVTPPPEAPAAPELYPFYLFELRTNNNAVAAWFAELGLTPEFGEVSRDWTLLPSLPMQGFGQVMASVTDDGHALYEFIGVTGNSGGRHEAPDRFFFGPNPATDYFDQPVSTERWSGSWEGKVTMAEGTEMSNISGGTNEAVGLTGLVDATTRVFMPPALPGDR